MNAAVADRRLDEILRRGARQWAARPALAWETHEFTYAELDQRVDDLARQLSRIAAPGERVGILVPNVPAFVLAAFAVWRAGCVAVLLNARWREFELRSILQNAELAALFCTERHGRYSFAELVSRLLPELPTLRQALVIDAVGTLESQIAGAAAASEPSPADVALMHYTSGTTGEPRGVMLRQDTPAHCGQALSEILQSGPADVVLLVLPLAHAFGLLALVAALVSGSLGVLVDSTFSLAPLLEAIERRAATILHGPPSLFASLRKADVGSLASLRTGLVGGSISAPSLLTDLESTGFRVLNSYGMTEIGAASACRSDDPPAIRSHTVGRPLPGYEFRVVGGPQGPVQVKTDFVMKGYFRQPALTDAAFDGPWFSTGDIGSIDAAGNLSILGRSGDVIHVAGLKVFPAEVENCLLTHPEVAEAAVFGVSHEAMGEAPAACVVLVPGAQAQANQLLQFARRSIAGYKLPYLLRVVSSIPRLPSGKPDRPALARRVEEERNGISDARD
jgi:long-chain acyl-CoA synthetase